MSARGIILKARKEGQSKILISLLVLLFCLLSAAAAGAAFNAQVSNAASSFTASSSFMRMQTGSYTGNGADNRNISGVGFQPQMVIVKSSTNQIGVVKSSTMVGDASKAMTGTTNLATNRIQSLISDGFQVGTNAEVNSNGVSYYWTAFKSYPGKMVISSYTGNGSSNRSITGLGFQPDHVWIMPATTQSTTYRQSGMSSAYRFDTTAALTTGLTGFHSTGFSVGNGAQANTNGITYHYVAWENTPESVQTGSYSGNGSDNRNISLGFQPQYVIVNRSVASTRAVNRPSSLAGDSTLSFQATASSSNMVQSLNATGFQVGTDVTVNSSGSTYYYIAFKD